MWRPMYDALLKGKEHWARGSKYDLFIAYKEVLKLTKRQRLTRVSEVSY